MMKFDTVRLSKVFLRDISVNSILKKLSDARKGIRFFANKLYSLLNIMQIGVRMEMVSFP